MKKKLTEIVKEAENNEKMSTTNIEGGLQVIDNVGDIKNSLEVRYEKGDTEILLTGTDDSGEVRIWFQKEDIDDLLASLKKAQIAMK